jgi:hypothetical protein
VRKIVLTLSGSILILLIIITVIGYCKYKPKPSELEVFVNNQSALVQPGTYSLEKWGREATDDTYSDPITLVRNDDPLVVGPSQEIMFEFENSPQTVKYYLWDVKTGKLAYKGLKGYPLKLEDSNVESGDYAMEIRAKWENGYVLYSTRILVFNDAK